MARAPALQGRLEVIVVGAGAIGLSCAVALAERGAAVTVLETGFSHHGDPQAASWAAAGMLGPISERMGETGGPAETLALGAESLMLWRNPSWSGAVHPCGALVLGDTRERAARLVALAAAAHSVGLPAEMRDAGLWLPAEGVVDIPAAFAQLARRLAAAGGAVRTGAQAVAVEAGAVSLLDAERLRADCVVLAPGLGAAASLTESAPALQRLFPAKGQMLRFGVGFEHVVRADGAYVAPRGGGCVVGATMELGRADRDLDGEALARLHAAAARAVPALAGVKPLDAWAGVRPMSPDWAPMIGRSGSALVAAGHARNGWLLAPITGYIISALAHGDALDPRWAAFDPARFEKAP